MIKWMFILFLANCKSCGSHSYTAWGIWWDINSISTIKVYISDNFGSVIRDAIVRNVINTWGSYTPDHGFSLQYTPYQNDCYIGIYIHPDLGADEFYMRKLAKTDPVCFNDTTGRIDAPGPCRGRSRKVCLAV